MRQEFQGAVTGGVAGRDIRNEAPKFQIGGNVEAAVNAEGGATIHIHVAAGMAGEPARNTLQSHHWETLNELIQNIRQIDAGLGATMQQQLRERYGNLAGEIEIDRYPEAWQFLTDQYRQAREAPERRQLLRELLSTADERNTKAQVKAWSEARFGTSFFKTLALDDLRQVHRYVMETWPAPPPVEAPTPVTPVSAALPVNDPVAPAKAMKPETAAPKVEPIPPEQARHCPQCKETTWLRSRLCRHCQFDLVRHDFRVVTRSKIERVKKIMTILVSLGVSSATVTTLMLDGIPQIVGIVVSFIFFSGSAKGLERIVELRQEAGLK